MEENQTIVLVAGAAILAIVAVAVIGSIVRRRRRARALQAPIPLIPFSSNHISIARPSRADGMLPPQRARDVTTPADVTAWAPPPVQEGFATAITPTASAPVAGPPPVTPARAPGGALADTAVAGDEVMGDAVDGASVRYWRPADGTLQFLPGRLEVIAGRDAGQEIRFVRTPGPDGTRVTFGRAEGVPYRHVQLREPTVSRAHARMTLEYGAAEAENSRRASPSTGNVARWRLENLSATNPVVVNGRPLGTDGGSSCAVTLADGDRIEMGEVVFRFHEK